MKYTSKLIYHHLANAQNIIIVPHQKPDGDALGAVLAIPIATTIGVVVEDLMKKPPEKI